MQQAREGRKIHAIRLTIGTDPRRGDGAQDRSAQGACAPRTSWRRCWEAVRTKGKKGHDKVHHKTTTTASQTSEESVTTNGYGRTRLPLLLFPADPFTRTTRIKRITGLARPQGGPGISGGMLPCNSPPHLPPCDPLKPFSYILYAIMFLCDSAVRSSASWAAPLRGSQNQVIAG